ncbi:MmgE/PrpD family protein [Advenella mimigardefordensis]|uniref:Putative 2-methylcitrate dehydratase PrpD n=1 Tax=Advenella mimigardefordensis (strain DSM 17166 / LMG 22922 / DPN7) TaxID=1247726 RepID=W0PFN1_ADVMD|nr:MmgE/PrpD family protein [Advenella mimigardefordensis]AHG64100.1 putative 2-methylcitrate dehydratase PrpD [Advenella mimigardefordensis DPN7]
MTPPTDLSHEFAEFIINTRFEDLSPDAVDGAKKSILDTIGVILAATGVEPAVKAVNALITEAGGTPESSLMGFGGRAPAVWAAFHNGAMAHCLDFDDHAPEGHHPSSSIVPAVFALAERRGGVSGKQLIAAVAAGQDMFLRMRRHVPSRLDWHLTTVLGVFSAAASAAHVLGLTKEQTISALGIAGMQSCGTLELAYGVGSDLRGMYAGFSTKGAVLAALMAQKGIRGVQSMFEGKAGLFNVYFDNEYDRTGMIRDLGQHYHGGEILYKPWPSCGASHGFIHATLELMREHQLKVADISEIRVNVGDFQKQLCEPIESRRRPATAADAKFSIPYCVAVAATNGSAKLTDFIGDALADPQVLATAEKITAVVDAQFNWAGKLPKGRLDIITHDGRSFSRVGDNVPGDIECPMDWTYLSAKFSESAALAAVKPASDGVMSAIEMIQHLDRIDDATLVLRVLEH